MGSSGAWAHAPAQAARVARSAPPGEHRPWMLVIAVDRSQQVIPPALDLGNDANVARGFNRSQWFWTQTIEDSAFFQSMRSNRDSEFEMNEGGEGVLSAVKGALLLGTRGRRGLRKNRLRVLALMLSSTHPLVEAQDCETEYYLSLSSFRGWGHQGRR